jgi:transposase InsO family protein
VVSDQGSRPRSRDDGTQKLNPQNIVPPVGADHRHDYQALARLVPERLDGIGTAACGLKVDDFPIGPRNGGSRRRTWSFPNRTTGEHQMAPNQLWQTDFTYLKVIGWGWFYLSTILDDFSRYIVASKLCTTMKAEDVTDTLNLALTASGCDQARVIHKPRLLSDNGSSYVSADLAEWLDGNGMDHVRGAPPHPQTKVKIERWHQTLKNRILLENYYLPGDLEAQIGRFVEHYNHRRHHESLKNLTPAYVYSGRG